MESNKREAAQKILEMRAPPELQVRVEFLRHKANEGTLTPDEDAEHKSFVEMLDLISLLQAKARRFLSDV